MTFFQVAFRRRLRSPKMEIPYRARLHHNVHHMETLYAQMECAVRQHRRRRQQVRNLLRLKHRLNKNKVNVITDLDSSAGERNADLSIVFKHFRNQAPVSQVKN